MTTTSPSKSEPPQVTAFALSPLDLEIAPNVRKDTKLSKDFLRSIKEHGVLVPVLVRPTPLGRYEVIEGQRRTIAASNLGLESIPVALYEGVRDDADLTITQLVANDERAEMTAMERAQGIQQLALMGVAQRDIIKRTGKSKAVVQAALDLADNDAATPILDAKPEIDLVRASQIAAFTEHEDLRDNLLAAAEQPDFDHLVERAHTESAKRFKKAEAEREYQEKGYEIITGSVHGSPNIKALYELTDAPGSSTLKAETHAECPGRAVALHVTYEGSISASHYCTQWKTAGHYVHGARNTAGATSGEQSEEEKAARRHVKDMNKKADAARAVHEKWVTDFFNQPLTQMPKDLHLPATRILAELLGQSRQVWPSDATNLIGRDPAGSPHAAARYLFALAVGASMRYYTRDYWRSNYEQIFVIPCLKEMAALGYPLADFEQDLITAASKKTRK